MSGGVQNDLSMLDMSDDVTGLQKESVTAAGKRMDNSMFGLTTNDWQDGGQSLREESTFLNEGLDLENDLEGLDLENNLDPEILCPSPTLSLSSNTTYLINTCSSFSHITNGIRQADG